VTYSGVKPNSPNAVADVKNEQVSLSSPTSLLCQTHTDDPSFQHVQAYYTLLDSQCDYMKSNGVAWFFHLYSDSQEPGYGLYTTAGKTKFKFKPQTVC
jgi:hypothetical protein